MNQQIGHAACPQHLGGSLQGHQQLGSRLQALQQGGKKGGGVLGRLQPAAPP